MLVMQSLTPSWPACVLLVFLNFRGPAATFTTITTSKGSYALSTSPMDFATAQATCGSRGLGVTSFTSNLEFHRLTEFLDNNVDTYDGMELWVSVSVEDPSGTPVYRFGNQEVESANWFPFEPSQDCLPTSCCYRIRNFRFFTINTPFGLTDTSSCSSSKYVLCGPNSATTTTLATTSTTAPTAATTSPTILTTAPTAGTTSPTILTTTPGTAVIVTAPVTATTTLVPLSTGQQMSIIYLGLVIGTSLAISCVCSALWLAINRQRRTRHEDEGDGSPHKDNESGDRWEACSSSSEEE